MDLAAQLLDVFLHLDRHLDQLILTYRSWSYLILFAIIFCETGLVVTPFLPGDSLLFAVGTFAARGSFELALILQLLAAAAILGDNLNYWIGRKVGPRVFQREDSRLLNRRHLLRTHAFYEKHGVKTIIIARFLPIIRTFSPFVAGIGAMSYGRFLPFDVVGGVVWVGTFLTGGFFFGNIEVVREHFSIVVLFIILISVLPAMIEFARHRLGPQASE
jgi:membrane-associated protein